jgi:hypothetical protein
MTEGPCPHLHYCYLGLVYQRSATLLLVIMQDGYQRLTQYHVPDMLFR